MMVDFMLANKGAQVWGGVSYMQTRTTFVQEVNCSVGSRLKRSSTRHIRVSLRATKSKLGNQRGDSIRSLEITQEINLQKLNKI